MAKIQWQGGGLDLTGHQHQLFLAFVGAFLLDRLRRLATARMPRAAITLSGFMLVFLAVYLCRLLRPGRRGRAWPSGRRA